MVAPGRMATFCIVVRKEGLFGIPPDCLLINFSLCVIQNYFEKDRCVYSYLLQPLFSQE